MRSRTDALRLFATLARLGIGVGLLVYLARSGVIDWRRLSMLVTAWPITVAAVGLLLLDVTLMALRLSWLFRPHGLRVPPGRAVQLTLVGFFFGTFMPGATGGDLARLFYTTTGNSGRRTEIATVVILDRAIGLLSLLAMPLIFAPMFPTLLRTAPTLRVLLIAVAGAAAGLLGILVVGLFGRRLVGLWPGGPLDRLPWSARVLGTLNVYRRHPWILAGAFAISLCANLLLVPVTALAMLALNPSGLAASMCFLIPMGYIVNSVPLTPSGLGVGEAAFNALFGLAGLTGGAEALLGWRVWTAVVGLLGLVVYLRGLEQVVFEAEHITGGAQTFERSPLPPSAAPESPAVASRTQPAGS
jgi:uncharacterized membrane protein YbhN (UPF0104 family)